MNSKFFVSVVSCIALSIAACATNDSEARKAMEDNGFTDVTIVDRGFLFATFHGCDKRDGNWYHASANNPADKPVTMLVCCGAALSFKGCTIRSK